MDELSSSIRAQLQADMITRRGQLLALSYTIFEAQALYPAVEVTKVDGAGRANAAGVLTPCVRGIPQPAGQGSKPAPTRYSDGDTDPAAEVWEVPAAAAPLFLEQRGVSFRCEGVLYDVDRAEEIAEGSTLIKVRLFCLRSR